MSFVSLLSKLFGKYRDPYEQSILDMYVAMYSQLYGNEEQAKAIILDAIDLCKNQGKSEETANLPSNFGDILIAEAENGNQKAKNIVEKARREGATDDDIREWWNLPDLSRRMVLWSENNWRFATFSYFIDEKYLSDEAAGKQVHLMFPKYGDPEDTSILSGENRPLPQELRGRVDEYRQKHGADNIKRQAEKYSSYNAFVRDAIRKGLL